MDETPLPYIVRACRKRETSIGFCVLFVCGLSSFALIAGVGRFLPYSRASLLWAGFPWIVYAVNDVRVYLWKRRVRRRVFDGDRLKTLPCEHCLYDCTGNVSGKCPECGADIPPDLAQRWENSRRTFWLVRLRGLRANDDRAGRE